MGARVTERDLITRSSSSAVHSVFRRAVFAEGYVTPKKMIIITNMIILNHNWIYRVISVIISENLRILHNQSLLLYDYCIIFSQDYNGLPPRVYMDHSK